MRKPSLSALRAFEATARLGSLRKAGLELEIDHAIVSRHVRDVQNELGVKLLERVANRLELTATGKLFSEQITSSFRGLDRAVAQARSASQQSVLNVFCIHGFAQRWLMPRLDDLNRNHPSIEVQLRAVDEKDSAFSNTADIEIRYTDKAEGRVLFRPHFFPVVAPTVGKALYDAGCRDVTDYLSESTQICEMDGAQWAQWASATLEKPLTSKRVATFSNANIAIEAAVLGKGIALANDFLVREELSDGSLIRILNTMASLNSYVLTVHTPETKSKSKKLFCSWLENEVRDFGCL